MLERALRLVLVTPPTAWESRPAQAARYEQVAALVERRGKDAFTRAVRAVPPPPIFSDEPSDPAADIPEALFPFVFRGAAASDLPAPDDVRRITQPALVLAWDTDPGHPVATAERGAQAEADATAVVTQAEAVLAQARADHAAARARREQVQVALRAHALVADLVAGEPCPVCDDTVRAVEYRAYTVAYCPTCQTGGKVLADNTTSKFLK